MPQFDYEEFDLQLDRAKDGYTVRVVKSPIGPTGPESFTLPGNAESLKLLVLTLRAVRGVRSLESDTAPDAKKYGGQLFDAVFHDDILSALRGSLHVANTTGRGLRVRLKFTDPSVLANVPWELLYDTERHRFLSQYGKYPVVRYIDIPEPVTPLKVAGPVRMLVVISAPRDYPEIDTEREWERLSSVLKPFIDSGRLQVERLPTASLAALHRALLEDEYHVFHYIGHGGVDPRSGDGVLALTGPDGLSRLESGTDVGVMLSNSPIRLAVFNSCEGARISDVDPYASTAISLVQQGIPAVVAMQFEISDDAAFAFSSTLYDSITEGRPIDLAVTLARQAILATSRSEWATPVLYLRTSDGVIFDITAPPVPPPPPAPPPPPPEPAPPEAPVGLTGNVVGRRDVDLRWEVPVAGTRAASWEVLRDGTQTSVVTVPGVADVVPGPGTYTYTVVALDEDGRRSSPSQPFTVDVKAPAPAPFTPPPVEVPPVAPPPPRVVGARVARGSVHLAWTQEEGAGADATVAHWIVTRDGKTIGRVEGEPRLADDHPDTGKHAYAVTAVGRGGGRSAPSDPLVVRVGGASRAWLALLLLPLLAGLVWFVFLRDDGAGVGAPSAPTGVVAQAAGLEVTVTWHAPASDSAAVREWRVLRSGSEVGTVDRTSFTDTVPGPGAYGYTVVAIGEDGAESDASGSVRITVSGPTSPPPPTTVTVARANLTARFPSPEQATQGDGRIELRVDNAGPSRALTVAVAVSASAPGSLSQVTMGSSNVRCTQHDDTAVCRVERINAGGRLSMVIQLRAGAPPFTLTVRAASAVEDPDEGDNTVQLDVVPPSTSTSPTAGVLTPSPLTVTP